MKTKLCILVMCLPLIMTAQETGIKWTTGLSWEQIKQKAKQENKYIFLDVFTTWCGPCKLMDRDVYTNDTVAHYFNERFIAVKVQMDQTKKDDENVKAWYSTAAEFTNQYRIEGYPTLIFLSPQAKVIGKELGGRGIKELITIAQTATEGGKKYEDKYAEYDRLVIDYKAGKINYEKLPYMINVAYQFGEEELGSKLMKEHTAYVESLPIDKRFTKQNINFWSSFSCLNRDGYIFQYFYRNGKLIDKVMNQPGYAADVIDKTIRNTIVDSFYRMQRGETTFITGEMVKNSEVMFLTDRLRRLDGKIYTDEAEANWKKLYRMLRKEFDKHTAERNVLSARVKWYVQHQNKTEMARYTLKLYSKYPPDIKTMNIAEINEFTWNVFLYVSTSEKKIINSTLKWTEKALEIAPNYMGLIDTYANLLYKAGSTKDAIHWEEKAVSIAKEQKAERAAKGQLPLSSDNSPEYFQSVVDQMKRGEKTYTKEGAMWN